MTTCVVHPGDPSYSVLAISRSGVQNPVASSAFATFAEGTPVAAAASIRWERNIEKDSVDETRAVSAS